MKTQIIQLEPHDDTISVQDKMGWSQTGRVVLVWPSRGRLLDRRLDLVLLLRHSQSLGVQIALVTNDPEVRFQASSLGIPVYKSIRKAQKERWRRPKRSKFNSNLERDKGKDRLEKLQEILVNPLHRKRETPTLSQPIRLGLFAMGVLAVLSIAAVLLPSADIEIIPETRSQTITLSVEGSDSIDKINLTGILPIRRIKTIVEGRRSIQTTGSVTIPSGFATGMVLFTNLTDQSIRIPTGTVVSTSDSALRFITQSDGPLPAGPGEEIEIPIKALTPGSSANLRAGQINAIEGELGVFLTVENIEPTRGGSQSPSPAPAPIDRTQLREELISTLTQNALEEIRSSLDPEDILLDETLSSYTVIAETYLPEDLQPASELELTLRLEFETSYVSVEDQELLANAVLNANIPESYTPIQDTTVIEHITSPKISTTGWQMQFSREIQSEPSFTQAVNLSLGRSPDNASQLMVENMSLSAPPLIKTTPSWWPVMPLIPLRISVITAGSEQTMESDQSVILE